MVGYAVRSCVRVSAHLLNTRAPGAREMSTVAAVIGVRRAILQRQLAEHERQRREQEPHRVRHQQVYNEQYIRDATSTAATQRQQETAKKAQELYELLLSFPTQTHQISEADCECAICLAHFRAGDRLKRLTCPGSHSFHSRCLRQWFETGKTNCPTCRHECCQGPT